MEKKYNELLDYCNISYIKNIWFFWNSIPLNILNYFDKTYFKLVKFNNINKFLDFDLLILPILYKEKFKYKKIYCLYYDKDFKIDFWILNKNMFKYIYLYKEKYFLNEYFFKIIRWIELDKIIFWSIYVKNIELDRFKICFSNWCDIYIETLKENNCYFNFWKIQILVNYEKVINNNDKVYLKLLLKIIIKRIEINLLKII